MTGKKPVGAPKNVIARSPQATKQSFGLAPKNVIARSPQATKQSQGITVKILKIAAHQEK